MQTLPQLLPTTHPATIADHEIALPDATPRTGESFHDAMTRALSPEDGKASTTTGTRARINAGAGKKANAPVATAVGGKTAVDATSGDSTDAVKPDAKIKAKAGAKPGADHSADVHLTAQNGTDSLIPALKMVPPILTDSLLSPSPVSVLAVTLPAGMKSDDSMPVGALFAKADAKMTVISGLASAGINSAVQTAAASGTQSSGVNAADLPSSTASGAEALAAQMVAEAFSRLQSDGPQKTGSPAISGTPQSGAGDLSALPSPQFPLIQAAQAQSAGTGVVPAKVQWFDTQDLKPVSLAGFKTVSAATPNPVKDSEMTPGVPEVPAGLEAWRAQNLAPVAVSAATVEGVNSPESLMVPAGFPVSNGIGLNTPGAESILNGALAPASASAPVSVGNAALTEVPSGLETWRAQNQAPITAVAAAAPTASAPVKTSESFAIPVAMPQSTEFPVAVSFASSRAEAVTVAVNPAPTTFPVADLGGLKAPAAVSSAIGLSSPVSLANAALTDAPSGLDAWRAQNQGLIPAADAFVTSPDKAASPEVLSVPAPAGPNVSGLKKSDLPSPNISMAPATPAKSEMSPAAPAAVSPVQAQAIGTAPAISSEAAPGQPLPADAAQFIENQLALNDLRGTLPGGNGSRSIFGEVKTVPVNAIPSESPAQTVPAAASPMAPAAVGSQPAAEAEKNLPDASVLSNPGQIPPVNPSLLASSLISPVKSAVKAPSPVLNPVSRPKGEAAANARPATLAAGQKEALKPANGALNGADNGSLTSLAAEASAAPADATVPSRPAQAGDAPTLKNQGLESAAHSPSKVSGTVNAKQTVSMKNMEQTNKVAGQAEKVLPGDVVSVARENNLPSRSVFSPVPAQKESALAGVPAVPVVSDHSVRVSESETVAVANGTPLRNETLERTHELVAQHALRLTELKTDTLQVVLKPGAGTQLSLELRQRDGGVEAQAILQQGDYEHLKQRWPELQQQMEQRGIKLAPLTTSENSTAWSGGQGFQKNQPNQPEETESLPVETLARFVPARAMAARPEKQAAHAAASGGWQMWA